jgi:hypothetical protein
MRTGAWPERLTDVKETEDLLASLDLDAVQSTTPSNK